MAVLDTNVIIRYLTQDDPNLGKQALAIFDQVESGSLTITLLEGVLVETVQVLSSRSLYNVSREAIRARLTLIIRLPHVDLPNKRTYLEAFDLYVDHPRLSFVDALCVAYAQRAEDATVISFDRGYRNIAGLRWVQS